MSATRWPLVALSEILHPAGDPVPVRATESYPNLGIYGFGRGTFAKPDIEGLKTGASTLYRVRGGQFIYSRLFAFEGAFAIVPAELDGRFVSNEFPTLDVVTARALPGYLAWVFQQPSIWAAAASLSVGMGDRRRRVHPEALLTLRIPLPTAAEQQRIVARLDGAAELIARRVEAVKEIEGELARLLIATHLQHPSTRLRRLGDLLVLHERREPVRAGTAYSQAGIRGFGLGLFRKPAVVSSQTTYKHFNQLEADCFVVSQVKGWEGAVAVCDEEHQGLYVSPEYRTFTCRPDALRPHYLMQLIGTSWMLDRLARLTRGQGARRERLRPEALLADEWPMPSVEAQEALEPVMEKARAAVTAQRAATAELNKLLPALLHETFGPSADDMPSAAA